MSLQTAKCSKNCCTSAGAYQSGAAAQLQLKTTISVITRTQPTSTKTYKDSAKKLITTFQRFFSLLFFQYLKNQTRLIGSQIGQKSASWNLILTIFREIILFGVFEEQLCSAASATHLAGAPKSAKIFFRNLTTAAPFQVAPGSHPKSS